MDYPALSLKDARFPAISAHGTREEALGGVFQNGLIPGNRLKRGGRDEVPFRRIDVHNDLGCNPRCNTHDWTS